MSHSGESLEDKNANRNVDRLRGSRGSISSWNRGCFMMFQPRDIGLRDDGLVCSAEEISGQESVQVSSEKAALIGNNSCTMEDSLRRDVSSAP